MVGWGQLKSCAAKKRVPKSHFQVVRTKPFNLFIVIVITRLLFIKLFPFKTSRWNKLSALQNPESYTIRRGEALHRSFIGRTKLRPFPVSSPEG